MTSDTFDFPAATGALPIGGQGVAAWRSKLAAQRNRFRGNSSSAVAAWGAVDHALVSGFSLVITIWMARSLGAEQFGLFAVANAAIFLFISVQLGVVGQPHNVLSSSLEVSEYRSFTSSAGVVQALLIGILILLMAVAGIVSAQQHWAYTAVILATIPALIATQASEMFRRVMYSENETRAAAHNSILRYGGQLLLCAIWWRLFGLHSAVDALLLLSAAAAFSCVRAAWVLRGSFAAKPSRQHISAIVQLGKWFGGAAVVGWFSTQVYLLIAMAVVGPGTIGVLKAGETFFRPVGVALAFGESMLPIRFSRVQTDQGIRGLRHAMNRTSLIVVPALVIGLVALGLAGVKLIPLVFGKEYAALYWMPLLYAVYFALLVPAKIVSSGLRALKSGRFIMVQAGIAAVIGTITAYPIIAVWGGYGVLVGMIAISVVSLVILMYGFHRYSVEAGEPTLGLQ